MDRLFFNCDYSRYVPTTINNVKIPTQHHNIDFPREERVISLKDSYIKKEIDTNQLFNDDYATGTDASSIILGPIVFF